MSSTLLPCPFCGGEAAVRDIKEPSVNGWVGCQRCRCFMDFVNNGKPLAIAAWNRRADDENKPLTCDGCESQGEYENEVEYGYPSPCTRCARRVIDNYRAKPKEEQQ